MLPIKRLSCRWLSMTISCVGGLQRILALRTDNDFFLLHSDYRIPLTCDEGLNLPLAVMVITDSPCIPAWDAWRALVLVLNSPQVMLKCFLASARYFSAYLNSLSGLTEEYLPCAGEVHLSVRLERLLPCLRNGPGRRGAPAVVERLC